MSNITWYPQIELSRWLAKNPSFREDLPIRCLCGNEVSEVIPFVTAYSIGISTGECPCGIKDATTVSKPRNAKLVTELVQLVADLARR